LAIEGTDPVIKRGLTPTQRFIVTVFGLMVVAGGLSVFGLLALNANQAAPGSSTPNPNCTRQLAGPASSNDPAARNQAYLDADYAGCQSLGMSESAAVAFLNGKGLAVRIASRDGQDFMLTADYSDSRVNLTVMRSVVTKYNVG
jgi:hypothetical protein